MISNRGVFLSKKTAQRLKGGLLCSFSQSCASVPDASLEFLNISEIFFKFLIFGRDITVVFYFENASNQVSILHIIIIRNKQANKKGCLQSEQSVLSVTREFILLP